MQLGTIVASGIFVGVLSACGPTGPATSETAWALGWFSDLEPENQPLYHEAATRYDFRDDNTVGVVSTRNCDSSIDEWTLSWEALDRDTLLITIPEEAKPHPSEHLDGWRLERRGDCEFELVSVLEAEDFSRAPVFRGRLCMEAGEDVEECVGSTCNTCYKSWCEGTPTCSSTP